MNIYLAAGRHRIGRARSVARALRRAGHHVTSRWLNGRSHSCLPGDNAMYSLADIVVADCLVLIARRRRDERKHPETGDRHVELGYALRAGKRVCVLGEAESLFHCLPDVERYGDMEELIHGLG